MYIHIYIYRYRYILMCICLDESMCAARVASFHGRDADALRATESHVRYVRRAYHAI